MDRMGDCLVGLECMRGQLRLLEIFVSMARAFGMHD